MYMFRHYDISINIKVVFSSGLIKVSYEYVTSTITA